MPRHADLARQAQRMRPQLSVKADMGAVRAALLCRFADDLSHFGSRTGRLWAPAMPAGEAISLPAEPVAPRRPALSYNTLFEVAPHPQEPYRICEAVHHAGQGRTGLCKHMGGKNLCLETYIRSSKC